MCGFIVADIAKVKPNIEGILHHRGPDGVESFSDDVLVMVHNRLAIIDLNSHANQPMQDKKTGYQIVLNGEIYNFKEIRREFNLECQTNSDTEVLLQMFIKFGTSAFSKLNGIFSFLIYDPNEKKIIGCRDRFGIKPLYYDIGNGGFAFSSEMKGLLKSDYAINFQAVSDYMNYGLLNHSEDVFFDGIKTIPAGNYFIYDITTSHLKLHPYWKLEETETTHLGEADVLNDAYELTKEAINFNLVADVEVALSLSSGVDSAFLSQLLMQKEQKFKAFTFGFENADYDEVANVQKMYSSNFEIIPTYLKIDEMLPTLKEAIYFFETPLGGLGTLSAYNMMKEVKSHNIKVILAGEGSDEAFGGYQYYFESHFRDLLNHDDNTNLLSQELTLYRALHPNDLRSDEELLQDEFDNSALTVKAPDGTAPTSNYCGTALEPFAHSNIKLRQPFSSQLKNMMYADLAYKKLPKLLHFQDRSSMASGVEARVPFLDHNLVSYLYGLPGNYKIRSGQTKYLLRKMLQKYFNVNQLPPTKHYVATPQREWIKHPDIKNEIIETVRFGTLNALGFMNFERFYEDYTAYAEADNLGNSFFVWKIINLEYLLSLNSR